MRYALILAAATCALAGLTPRHGKNEAAPYIETLLNKYDNAQNLCGDSTLTRETTNSSPSVADCKALAAYFSSHVKSAADMKNSHADWHPLLVVASHNSCHMSMEQTNHYYANDPGRMGFQDFADLLNGAIANAAENGKVGASGQVSCQEHPNKHMMFWRIH
ncbi:putative necrosis-inducing factor-domain-containing protein [Xylariaceae sp. FL0804]|nr:putative necrosis-inducing factor-domain-containing protein [Xylariaceae sp. FL0804]